MTHPDSSISPEQAQKPFHGGRIEKSINGFIYALEYIGLSFAYNMRSNEIHEIGREGRNVYEEITAADLDKSKQWTDGAFHLMRAIISQRFTFSDGGPYNPIEPALFNQSDLRSFIMALAYSNRYDPIQVWLEGLPAWDGEKRMDYWVTNQLGAVDKWMAAFASRAILLGGITRVYQPGQLYDCIPVLVGAQGLGKSSALQCLCPWASAFNDSLQPGVDDKIIIERTRDTLIVEFSELAQLDRSELETVKAFISRRIDVARLAWGHHTTDQPRRWVGVATANNRGDGILPQDESGYRRWAIVELDADKARPSDEIRKWVRANRDQLWAEALAIYKADPENVVDKYRMPAHKIGKQNELTNRYAKRHGPAQEAAELIAGLWETDGKARTISEWLRDSGYLGKNAQSELAKSGMRSFEMALSKELTAAGFEKKQGRIDGIKATRWYKP
ncbi:MAG: hypothetical protein OXI80_10700 [Caldilineaceae bacterium]|nr:hypothetical protein [Caldilineaceae bacterium]